MKLERFFGEFGGMYIPESLVGILQEVEQGFIAIQTDPDFQHELHDLLTHYAGRPTPITHAKNLSKLYGCDIYLKREDLLHGGAHKTNNCIGQGLLAKYLGKKRIIAETGAGQHGVATAIVGALLDIPVEIYMGSIDIARQNANVKRMELLGATVHRVTSGSQTLKDAVNEALRDWIANPEDTYYCLGSAVGPHPYPRLVRYFQEVIGREAREQMLQQTGHLPNAVFACVGGGSNAIGIFSAFLDDTAVQLFGAEAGGKGLESGQHAATILAGKPGVFHGMHSLFLQDEHGQIQEPHSISAGLDYPGIGPEHAYLAQIKRVNYAAVTDDEAIQAFELLSKKEGIIPAFESSHAIALALREAKHFTATDRLLINLSGRGDKDMDTYIAMNS